MRLAAACDGILRRITSSAPRSTEYGNNPLGRLTAIAERSAANAGRSIDENARQSDGKLNALLFPELVLCEFLRCHQCIRSSHLYIGLNADLCPIVRGKRINRFRFRDPHSEVIVNPMPNS